MPVESDSRPAPEAPPLPVKRPQRLAKPRSVARVGVLGAGLMGAGIAGASVAKWDVVMRDVSLEAVGRGIRAIESGLASRVKSGSLARVDADRQRSRLAPAT